MENNFTDVINLPRALQASPAYVLRLLILVNCVSHYELACKC
uniref:Uncharacterized protein n=1 Tax=Anguilla anguilla TaxID=7936 RepID=A0A0E9S5V8_ANGAN